MSLSNRIAFVDDADTPIGVAIVKALEARGAKVLRHSAKPGAELMPVPTAVPPSARR
jgi:hypothetical protein